MCFLIIVSVLCMGVLSPSAKADIIDYTFTGTAFFSLDSNDYSNDYGSVDFKAILRGDSTGVFDPYLEDPAIPSGILVNSVTGNILLYNYGTTEEIANFMLTEDSIQVFVDQLFETIGFVNASDGSGFLMYAPGNGLGSYALTAPFGPFSSQSIPVVGFTTTLSDGSSLVLEDVPFIDPEGTISPPATFNARPRACFDATCGYRAGRLVGLARKKD